MEREIIVRRLGEMTLAICEMQDVINKISAENVELRAKLAGDEQKPSTEQKTKE